MSVFRVKLWFLFLLLFSAHVFASAGFVWPLQKNYGVSATFGESRADHYHAGIDLSTNGKTGLPVLAIAEGSIYRLKIQKRGYGKALYIQHKDGMQSVYAHLDAYSAELGLEQLYQKHVDRKGTPYTGDIFLEPPIRIKQGQIVAFSGESGAGLPHLHLEIRKNENVALNPMMHGFRDVLDPVPPTFQAVFLYPLSHDSVVNGDPDTSEVRFTKKGSAFFADSTPVVRGDFAVSVSVYDAALRPYHRTPNRLIYSIDDREMYRIEFDQFSYNEHQGFGLLYDLGKPGPAYFEYPILMSKMAEFTPPFVKRSPAFSARTLSPGKHLLKIQAFDTNNNASIAEIPFEVNQSPIFVIDSVERDSTELAISANLQDANWNGSGTLSGEVEYSIDQGRTFKPVSLTSVITSEKRDHLRFRYRIPVLELQNSQSILIRARAFDGLEYSPYVFAKFPEAKAVLPASIAGGNIRYETYRNGFRLIFDSASSMFDRVQATIGNSPQLIPLEPWKPNLWIADIPAPKQSGALSVQLPGGRSVTIPVSYAGASGSAVVTTENSNLNVPSNALYADSWIWAKSLQAYSSKSLPVIGSMIQLTPRGLPFRKGATLAFSYPETVSDPEKLSIYRWDRASQNWTSFPSQLNRNTRTVETKIDYLDTFALIYDNVAPKISSIFPRKRSSTRNQSPVLAIHVKDSGMDVDDEKIVFYVDDVPLRAEYDPDRNTATAKVSHALKKGDHRFYAVAVDYAGNKTQSVPVTFRVK